MAKGMAALSENQLLAVDGILHTMALGVAVLYGLSGRRRVAVALACLSPIMFITLFFFGPGERMDGFPTSPAVAGYYVAANAFLVAGLLLIGVPKNGRNPDDRDGPRRLLSGLFSGYLVLVSLWVAVDGLL